MLEVHQAGHYLQHQENDRLFELLHQPRILLLMEWALQLLGIMEPWVQTVGEKLEVLITISP